MTFLTMMENLTRMESMDQVREELRKEWAPPRQSLDELAKQLDRALPGGYLVSEQDQAARAERRELTRAMRENMIYMLERNHWWQHEPHYRADSGLSRDLGTILDRAGENPTQYRRYYEILTGNDPQAKADLVMESVRSMDFTFRQLRNPPLNKMKDQDIVDNMAQIYDATQVVNQIFALVKNPALALSEAQKNELLKLEEEFAEPLAGAQTRMDSIASPFYEMFPTSRFQTVSNENLDEATAALGEENQLADYLYASVKIEKGFVAKGMISEVVRTKLIGTPAEEFTWMDDNGAELPLDQRRHLPAADETFMEGRPLIARHPNGWTRVFCVSRDNANHGLIEGDTKLLASFGVKDASKRALDGLKAADPWYISSSKEFKAMRSAMEAMEKASRSLGNSPTTRQLMELRELSQQLEQTSQAYLDYKGPEGRNETERSRINAARGVHEFAKRQSARMNTLFRLEPALEAETQRIKEQDQLRKQEEMRRKFKVLDNFLFDKQPQSAPEEKVQLQADKMEELLRKAGESYPKQPGEPTSALNSLHSFIGLKIHDMTYGKAGGGFQKAAKQAMVLMTAYDLIAQERNGRQSPGPMEKLCSENINGFATAIAKNDEMKKKLDGFITPERFERFIKENEGRKIAGRIIEKAKAPVQQQSAQQPQPAQTLAQPNPQRPGPAAKSK